MVWDRPFDEAVANTTWWWRSDRLGDDVLGSVPASVHGRAADALEAIYGDQLEIDNESTGADRVVCRYSRPGFPVSQGAVAMFDQTPSALTLEEARKIQRLHGFDTELPETELSCGWRVVASQSPNRGANIRFGAEVTAVSATATATLIVEHARVTADELVALLDGEYCGAAAGGSVEPVEEPAPEFDENEPVEEPAPEFDEDEPVEAIVDETLAVEVLAQLAEQAELSPTSRGSTLAECPVEDAFADVLNASGIQWSTMSSEIRLSIEDQPALLCRGSHSGDEDWGPPFRSASCLIPSAVCSPSRPSQKAGRSSRTRRSSRRPVSPLRARSSSTRQQLAR